MRSLAMVVTLLLASPQTAEIDALRERAEQGDAEAQVNLGFMYANDEGVPENDIEAVKWYRRSAEQGHPGGQFNLGVKYGNGEGVPENDAEAVKWYRLAAEQGSASAHHNLGLMYYRGDGVPQNNTIAYMWLNIAGQGSNWFSKRTVIRWFFNISMTPEQIAEGQRLAAECIEKKYKGCAR